MINRNLKFTYKLVLVINLLLITLYLLLFWKGGEISEPGSVDELSTGHFNMPYDMVREGKESVISLNYLVL